MYHLSWFVRITFKRLQKVQSGPTLDTDQNVRRRDGAFEKKSLRYISAVHIIDVETTLTRVL